MYSPSSRPSLASDAPIGIFDSGIGGLTVAHAIAQAMPAERMLYFGDTAHMPYGDRSPEFPLIPHGGHLGHKLEASECGTHPP